MLSARTIVPENIRIMRKRIVIVVLVLLGALVALILFRSLFNNEPQYRGKRLSEWFKQYYRTGEMTGYAADDQHQKAARAFRAIGTNAVPFLLTKFYNLSPDSPFQTNVHKFLSRLPQPFHFPPFVPANTIRGQAASAIREIKPPHDFLLPLVTNRLYSPDKRQRLATIYLLCAVGAGANEVMPFLLEMLRSTNGPEQLTAATRLQQLGPAARLALPDLVELVKRDDSDLRAVHAVCRTLGDFGNEGTNAIPALNARLKKEPRPTSRINFAKTLCQIDAQQTEALGVILNHTKSQGDANRVYALMSLGNIGPNAKAAVPILIEAATEDDAQIWNPAAAALLKIGETNLAFSAVADRLKHKDKQTRLSAAMFIVHYEPTNLVAISNLVEFARDSYWGRVAISELAKLRPVPQSAVLTLREIAASKDNQFRREAEKALRDIEAAKAQERDAVH